MNAEELEQAQELDRQQHNSAIANGLICKARRIEWRMKARQKQIERNR